MFLRLQDTLIHTSLLFEIEKIDDVRNGQSIYGIKTHYSGSSSSTFTFDSEEKRDAEFERLWTEVHGEDEFERVERKLLRKHLSEINKSNKS